MGETLPRSAGADHGPCAYIPFWLLRRREVSAVAKQVYGILLYSSGGAGRASVERVLIAECLGCDTRSIDRAIAQLRAAGLIETTRVGKRAVYTLPTHPWSQGVVPHLSISSGEEPPQLSFLTGETAPHLSNSSSEEGPQLSNLTGEMAPHQSIPSGEPAIQGATTGKERISLESPRKKKITKTIVLADDVREWFDRDFWPACPRKEGKQEAMASIAALNPGPELRAHIAACMRYGAQVVWRDIIAKGEMRFVPHPATWLNKRRFEDEVFMPPRPRPTKQTPPGVAAAVEENAFRRAGDFLVLPRNRKEGI